MSNIKITKHAVDQFKDRFDDRKIAYEEFKVVRVYLKRIIKTSKELYLKNKYIHDGNKGSTYFLNKGVLFVVCNETLITVYPYDKHSRFRFRHIKSKKPPKRKKKHVYHNSSSRKRRSLGVIK